MKRIYRWLGVALFVVATVYFVFFAIEHGGALYSEDWGPDAYAGFIYAMAAYCATLLVGAVAWSILMNGAGECASLGKLSTIFLLSQFAKYIPGNFRPSPR